MPFGYIFQQQSIPQRIRVPLPRPLLQFAQTTHPDLLTLSFPTDPRTLTVQANFGYLPSTTAAHALRASPTELAIQPEGYEAFLRSQTEESKERLLVFLEILEEFNARNQAFEGVARREAEASLREEERRRRVGA